MSERHHGGARNWFKAPADYFQSLKENLQSWGKGKDYLDSPCSPRQRLPTSDITCLLKTWETEYGNQYLKLNPILPISTYNFKKPKKTAGVTRCCGCGTRSEQREAGKAPCFYSSSGIDKNGGVGVPPKEVKGIREMLKSHSCYNDEEACSRFQPMPEYSPNWLKIRKAVQTLKGCGLFYRKENGGNQVPSGTRPVRPKQLPKCKNVLDNKNTETGGCEAPARGPSYNLVNDRSRVGLDCPSETVRPRKKSLTSPLDDFYGGRYTVKAKYVGDREDGRLRGGCKVDGLNKKGGLKKESGIQKAKQPEECCASQNGRKYPSGESTSCKKNYQPVGDMTCGRNQGDREKNLFFYNPRDGLMYHSSQFTSSLLNSPEYKDLYDNENDSGNGGNGRSRNSDRGQYAGDGPRSVSSYDVVKGQKAGSMMARQGHDKRTGTGKQSGSGAVGGSRKHNVGAGGGTGYSNITKAGIPDDGPDTGKFRPLEVVPKQGLDLPDDLMKSFMENMNRLKSEEVEVMSMSQSTMTNGAGKKKKRKKGAVTDVNENYVAVRKGRKVDKTRTIRFQDQPKGSMTDEPPKPEKLEFFKS